MNHFSKSFRSIISIPTLLVSATILSPLGAQACPYEVQSGSGYISQFPLRNAPKLTSPVLAAYGSNAGGSWFTARGFAISRPAGLTGICEGSYRLAVTVVGIARSVWHFNDLKFSSSKTQGIQALLNLKSVGSSSRGASFQLTVRLFEKPSNRLLRIQVFRSMSPGSQISPVILPVTTNKVYGLEIEVIASASGNQSSSKIYNHLTFKKTPFTLPSGVRADSKEAKIVNNSYTVKQGQVFPPMLTTSHQWLVQQTGTLNVNYQQYVTPKLTFLLIGYGKLQQCNVPVGPNLGLTVTKPIFLFPMTMDTKNKTASFKVLIPKSAKGLKFIAQAVDIHGTQIKDLYGSNPLPITIR
jgi:hypothetical protein